MFGLERCCVPDEAGVEVREDSKDALLNLAADLFLGDLLFGDGDLNVYGGFGDGKSDDRELAVFSGMEIDLVGLVWFEVDRGDPDPEGSGWQVFEDKKAALVCCRDAFRCAALIDKGNFGGGDDASVDVEDVSTDASVGLCAGRLRGCGLATWGVGQVKVGGCGTGYLLLGEYLGGEAEEKGTKDETVEGSGPGEISVFPMMILHLETPVPISCFF